MSANRRFCSVGGGTDDGGDDEEGAPNCGNRMRDNGAGGTKRNSCCSIMYSAYYFGSSPRTATVLYSSLDASPAWLDLVRELNKDFCCDSIAWTDFKLNTDTAYPYVTDEPEQVVASTRGVQQNCGRAVPTERRFHYRDDGDDDDERGWRKRNAPPPSSSFQQRSRTHFAEAGDDEQEEDEEEYIPQRAKQVLYRYFYDMFCEKLATEYGIPTLLAFRDRLKRGLELNRDDENHRLFVDSMLCDVRFVAAVKIVGPTDSVQPEQSTEDNLLEQMTRANFLQTSADDINVESLSSDVVQTVLDEYYNKERNDGRETRTVRQSADNATSRFTENQSSTLKRRAGQGGETANAAETENTGAGSSRRSDPNVITAIGQTLRSIDKTAAPRPAQHSMLKNTTFATPESPVSSESDDGMTWDYDDFTVPSEMELTTDFSIKPEKQIAKDGSNVGNHSPLSTPVDSPVEMNETEPLVSSTEDGVEQSLALHNYEPQSGPSAAVQDEHAPGGETSAYESFDDSPMLFSEDFPDAEESVQQSAEPNADDTVVGDASSISPPPAAGVHARIAKIKKRDKTSKVKRLTKAGGPGKSRRKK